MTKRVAVVQSNYIPWIGYFDLINSVDQFVFLDDVQYTDRDWRNRNKIVTSNGLSWLSVPVDASSTSNQAHISEVRLAGELWKEKHLEVIRRNYSRSNYFEDFFPQFESIMFDESDIYLSKLNQRITRNLCSFLGIQTELIDSSIFSSLGRKSEKLIEICSKLGATTYVSGTSAQSYLDVELFAKHGIGVEWFEYSYLAYSQLWNVCDIKVSVLDPIFQVGNDCLKKLKVN
jgi:hypothetical protein